MASAREQVAAYDYESRRRATGLASGADHAQADPRRRLNRILFASVMVAVLMLAGFGVAGALGGGRGPELPESGAVVVKGRGDRYVVDRGVVHPALNLASALLAGGGTLTEVRPEALDGRQRGLPVGIPGVPDALPPRDALVADPWTACVLPPTAQDLPSKVRVLVGLPAPDAGRLGTGEGIVVIDPADVAWLVQDGRRYLLPDAARRNLGLGLTTAVHVPAGVLDTLPEGPDLELELPADTPSTAPLPQGVSVGTVVEIEAPGRGRDYFVVVADGLSPISPFTSALLGQPTVRVDPKWRQALSAVRLGDGEWPDEVPRPVELGRDQPLCVSATPSEAPGDAAWAAAVSRPPRMPLPAAGQIVQSQSRDVPGPATEVVVAPGRGALVLATGFAGTDGVYTLVLDVGLRLRLASAEAAAWLGYDPGQARPLPRPFVDLLPEGPTLDATAAARELPSEHGTMSPP